MSCRLEVFLKNSVIFGKAKRPSLARKAKQQIVSKNEVSLKREKAIQRYQ